MSASGERPARDVEQIAQALDVAVKIAQQLGWKPDDSALPLLTRLLDSALRAARQDQWQPIETAPRDEPFLVCWAPHRREGERKPIVEMVGGWQEYEEVRSYGEPEAYGWHPLPRPLLSPMTVAARGEPED